MCLILSQLVAPAGQLAPRPVPPWSSRSHKVPPLWSSLPVLSCNPTSTSMMLPLACWKLTPAAVPASLQVIWTMICPACVLLRVEQSSKRSPFSPVKVESATKPVVLTHFELALLVHDFLKPQAYVPRFLSSRSSQSVLEPAQGSWARTPVWACIIRWNCSVDTLDPFSRRAGAAMDGDTQAARTPRIKEENCILM